MALAEGKLRPSGSLGLKVIRNQAAKLTALDVLRDGFPRFGLGSEVNAWRLRNCRRLIVPMLKLVLLNRLKVAFFCPALRLTLIRDGQIIPLGLASMKLVTTAGVTFIATRLVDAATTIGGFDFHGFGVGTTAENAADTALVTEETTQYVTDNVRPTGTPTNPSGNVYRSVGTYSPDSGANPRPITEHGLFSANAAGTLLDRSVFSVVNLVPAADSLQATYDLTLPSGG